MKKLSLTALLEKEGDCYVSLCPELDVASQGDTVDLAISNLKEAVEGFLECAPHEEVERRYSPDVMIARFEAEYA